MRTQLKELVNIGWPIGAQVAAELLGLAGSAAMSGWLGKSQLAAEQACLQYLSMLVIPSIAIAQSSGVLVGFAKGQGLHGNAKRFGNISLPISLVVPILATFAFAAVPRTLLSAFMDVNDPNNAEAVDLASTLLLVNSIGQLADSIRNVASGGLRGYYETYFPMGAGIFSMCIVALGLGYALGFPAGFGLNGIFVGRDIGMALGAAMVYGRWQVKSNEYLKVQEEPKRWSCNPFTLFNRSESKYVFREESRITKNPAAIENPLDNVVATSSRWDFMQFFRTEKKSIPPQENSKLLALTLPQNREGNDSKCTII